MTELEKIIEEIPTQVKKDWEVENSDSLPEATQSVIVCGMGGSGIIGDLLGSLLPSLDIHVHKDFGLPENAPENALFLVISYSGETKETLSCYQELKDKKVTVVTGGGELLKQVKKDDTPYIKVPWEKDIPARFNVGNMLGAALSILKAKIEPFEKAENKEKSEGLAQKIINKTVLIYTPLELDGLGLFWKEVLNETAKLPAFANTLPEATHNEIESVKSIKDLFLLFFKTSKLEGLAKEKGWAHETVNLNLINSIQLALLTAVKAAQIKNISPTATPLIKKNKSSSAKNTTDKENNNN